MRATDEVKPLKLRAHDTEDMRVVAGILQDALVPLGDVTYLKSEKRFILVANRFRWETAKEQQTDARRRAILEKADAGRQRTGAQDPEDASFVEDAPYERVNCGICFDKVRGVQTRNLDLRRRDQILNLLTVATTDKAIALHFSDGGVIRLEVTAIRCHLEDLGEPWPTSSRPWHPLDDDGENED